MLGRFLLCVFLLLGTAHPSRAQVYPHALRRAIYGAARCKLPVPPGLNHKIPQALIQLYAPGSNTIIGTGFILRHQNKLFAVFPHHIAGHQGHAWDIQLTDKQNNRYRFSITISKHGGFDEKHPDLAFTDLSNFRLPPIEALEMGTPALREPAYSFGYTMGRFDVDDFLPIQKHFLTQHGWELTTDRIIAGEKPSATLNIAGYCGAPLLQLQEGTWKAVGIHIGSCVYDAANFHLNHSTAVHLPKAFALLQKIQENPPHTVNLAFRGMVVYYLKKDDQVINLEIERDNVSIFWTEIDESSNFRPEKVEQFLEPQLTLQSNDRLIFTLQNRHKQIRRIELTVP